MASSPPHPWTFLFDFTQYQMEIVHCLECFDSHPTAIYWRSVFELGHNVEATLCVGWAGCVSSDPEDWASLLPRQVFLAFLPASLLFKMQPSVARSKFKM